MQPLELRPGIYSVGALDWDLGQMHGYETPRGVTYNSYLIVDEHITLVDTVKHYKFDELMSRISKVVDPSKIDYVVVNHAEPDHGSALPKVRALLPEASIFCSKRGVDVIEGNYRQDFGLKPVADGESLSLGKRSLVFKELPMLHWPDSMVSYCPEEGILFSNDAFGQHMATAERFDDEVGWSVTSYEAGKYYANIVMPFAQQVQGALAALGSLTLSLICPSHGVMLRSHIAEMLENYRKWSSHEAEASVAVIYYSMWGATRLLAEAIADGVQAEGLLVTLRNMESYHYSDVMYDVLVNRGIALGSPTLNNGLHPEMASMTAYLTGLRPRDRVGLAFGSYGWGGQSVGMLQEIMTQLKWQTPLEPLKIKWKPTEEDLTAATEAGRALAQQVKAWPKPNSCPL